MPHLQRSRIDECLKDTSIKTRIETNAAAVLPFVLMCLKDTSIKTRIETGRRTASCRAATSCLKDTSIKTRIETPNLPLERRVAHSVSKILPLKQGLKLCSKFQGQYNRDVSKILPLKQGLKPHSNPVQTSKILGLKDTFIKTRIETASSVFGLI